MYPYDKYKLIHLTFLMYTKKKKENGYIDKTKDVSVQEAKSTDKQKQTELLRVSGINFPS